MLITYERGNQIAVLDIDVTVRETHEARSTVSSHPRESRDDVTDNVRDEPIRLDTDIFVSNTPLTPVFELGAEFDRVADVHAELLRLKGEAVLLQLTTSLRAYSDMVIESILVSREASSGNALQGSLGFVNVNVVTLRDVQVTTPIETRGRKTKRAGNKKLKEVKKVPKISVLKALPDLAAKFF